MVVFARIDERLLHGQVAVKWTKEVDATDVFIVDNEVAASPAMLKMFEAVAPKGIRVTVSSVEDAPALLLGPELSAKKIKILLISKGPGSILSLIENNVPIPVLNVGNMGPNGTRKRYLNYFYANEQEVEEFKQILALGVESFGQNVPDQFGDGKKNLRKVLKL